MTRLTTKEYTTKYRKKLKLNPEKYKAYLKKQAVRNKRSYEKNPDTMKDLNLRRKFGINLATYHSLASKQGGVCAICKAESNGPKRKYFSVDHSHKTGKVRGLLCNNCNFAVGWLKDNIINAHNLIKYLEQNEENVKCQK